MLAAKIVENPLRHLQSKEFWFVRIGWQDHMKQAVSQVPDLKDIELSYGCCVLAAGKQQLYSVRLLCAFQGIDEVQWHYHVGVELSKRFTQNVGAAAISQVTVTVRCGCQCCSPSTTMVSHQNPHTITRSVVSHSSSLSDTDGSENAGVGSVRSSSHGSLQTMEDSQSSLGSDGGNDTSTVVEQLSLLPTPTRVSWGACKRSLDTCHRSFLVDRIDSLESKLVQCQQDLKRTKKENKRLASIVEKQTTDLKLCKLGDNNPLRDLDISKHKVRLTTKGIIALGLRKGLAVTSAVAFPLAALVDVSRWSVTRSEITVWSVLRARTAAFNRICSDRLEMVARIMGCEHTGGDSDNTAMRQSATAPITSVSSLGLEPEHQIVVETQPMGPPPQPANTMVPMVPSQDTMMERDLDFAPISESTSSSSAFCLGGTSFATDATNSSVWRRNKLQAVMINSAFMHKSEALNTQRYHDSFVFHSSVKLDAYLERQILHIVQT